MAWVLFRFPQFDLDVGASVGARLAIMGRTAMNYAMHRGPVKRHRPLFPLPLGDLVRVREAAWTSDFAAFCAPHFADLSMEEVWTAVTVLGLNGTAGYGRADLRRRATAMQADALKNIKQTVSRVLSADCALERPPAQAEKELATRFVSYTGEEVPKMQVLSIKAAKGALPPSSHGGSIDARGLVSEGTKWFLERPEESLVEAPPKDVKLQARVHIKAGEDLDFFKLLVERNICTWVADDDVLVVRGEKVLNGMFAVGKGTCVEPGLELQRTIMNLIPSNAVLAQAQGGTQDLPAITQYLSLVVGNDHDVVFFQSDMSSAFYLFRIPAGWSRMMCFNAVYPGHLLGLGAETYFRPACAVIPMGWNSAVSVMQEIAEKLTVLARLPPENRVRRLAPLPVWLTNTMPEAEKQNRPWYHVYLDNFCAMQLTTAGKSADAGHSLHDALEEAWSNQGVLSSAKKRIAGAATVQELGAYFQGRSGTIGPSAERLLRLVQTTLVCLGKKRLKHKWIQVIAGRWVHCMSFRRAAMVVLDQTWAYLAGKTDRPVSEDRVRQELFACCCIGLMIHSNLRARISSVTTASDASMTGGAVGQSRELTVSGQEFAFADHSEQSGGRILPILVLSLFNGIGGCFRCYDLVGVTPMVAISYELSKEGNRITSRRWPHVRIEKDVRSILAATVREWRLAYPAVEEIHVWGGFPCVGLSSVRAGRLNLDDPESGLFWELVRVIKLIRQVFGYGFKVKYAAENVASMDASAEAEISQALGVKPLRMDPAGVVPIHRPRYCWSNTELAAMDGVWVEEKERWFEVHMEQPYPDPKQWMEPDAEWPGYSAGAILPTCMKCIKRVRPPPKPAGLDRISNDGRLRWIADDFRFPPYQYDDRFVFWVNGRWRLASASERELLHGLGYEHTALAWNAGAIKQDPQGFEDIRKTLVGDSFSCFSFVYVAAQLCNAWIDMPPYIQLVNRMGLAPGFCCPINRLAPLERRLVYGSCEQTSSVAMLHSALLRRTNHTGSDVRISSGSVMNPKSYPRQSAAATWWKWNKVFAFKWQQHDHINCLETRAIVQAIEWRIRHLREAQVRIFHLTDSYVAMSIISKGRSSARMLKPLLSRLAALLMAFDLYLVISHVESTENPTDHDSRA